MKDILTKVNHSDGMTVPEGYFEDFAARMTASLPEREWERGEPRVVPRSFWQRVRPYVYLAAMFAGVWCMMNIFDFVRTGAGLGVETSATLAAAMDNDHFISDYFVNEGGDEYTLMEELYEDGFTPVAFTDAQ